MINFDEVIECLEMERKPYCDFSGCKEIQAINTAIRSLKAWEEVISEMRSKKSNISYSKQRKLEQRSDRKE